MNSKVKVGIVGCGKISDAYFTGCRAYDILEIAGCADLDFSRANEKGAQHGVPALSLDEIFGHPEIEILINLTIPQSHVTINERALNSGKHAYCEKPFALDSREGESVLAQARRLNLKVGCAPDTFLGGGLQTARKLIDDGAIGTPVSAMAFWLSRGHEAWHPAPEFYYKSGGGPMFDMGPYYVTALVNLLGPVARVSGTARRTFPERTITSEPLNGQRIVVDVPTHYMGVMEFASGAAVSIVTSFDVFPYPLPRIVVFGTESTLEVPDPNTFSGPVRLRSKDGKTYDDVPLTHSELRGRGTGVADMAYAIRHGRAHRASGELANHVVEVMSAFEAASAAHHSAEIASAPPRPAALPTGLPIHELDT